MFERIHVAPHLAIAAWVACLAASGVAQAQAPTPTYQIHHDVIRGRVTTDSGKVIADADVAITMAPDRTSRFARSDSAGRYEIVFEQGTGDYLLHIAAIGRGCSAVLRLLRRLPHVDD